MLKLYDFELSGHAHRARLMLSLLNLPYEKLHVNLGSGEHKQSEFRAINPFTQVPVLDDDGLIIRDSIAIIVHLANNYDPSWNPQDREQQAQVQQWLALAARSLAEGPARARLITVFGATFDQDAVIEASHQTLSVINVLLEGKQWMVGNKASIADVACYSYIAHAPEGMVSLDSYENIQRWLANVEQLDGFIAMQATPQPALSV
ncbi:glutathione S-transferase family protein [Alginatibacterium sediminis]|uniref:Glutathione S-transferase family protein n=1 Tax=Alginatibacterium sediminis TaxID=2164068 RepID=A0A420E6Y9_9ALTE|nr:glutathione S-transferase [Alginatibacterium sediminis]RKF13714.1 glutathione S-transferase family protein [Alginatibacterium sediminis]